MPYEIKYPSMSDLISFFSEEGGFRGKIYGELEKWALIAKVIWSNWLITWILKSFLFKISWMAITLQIR